MILISFLVLSTKMLNGFETIKMNPAYQYQRKFIQLTENEYTTNTCLTYGLWSKYNPLSTITQVGMYGLFDSHCFHLHNAIEQNSQSLNLIYYDCLDSVSRKIIKKILFINNLDEQVRLQIEIDSFDYENTWYYLQLIAYPSQNIFKLIFIKMQEVLFQTIKSMKYPFNDENLILSFGGNFRVHNSKIHEIKNGEIFSYFPGTIILQEFSIQSLTLDFAFIDIANQAYKQFDQCICQPNEKFLIGDKDFKQQEYDIYFSDNLNCESFILIGWIKIKEIINPSGILNYQLMKISPNLQNPIFQNQNLSPFQLFYHITSLQNEIEIITYSYTFPDVSIDFSDNPFLIKKKLLIKNKINIWHYLKVELLDNKLIVEITFYEGQEIFYYDAQFEVNHFHNCLFKLQYGNCQQTQMNYLNIQINNLEFFNCYKEITTQNCHYSCYECDGPTNQDCLSCSIESQRIYIQEHKVCICPYNTIDNQNKCQTYVDSNLRLIEDQNLNNNQNCKYGFFEFDGNCIQCPSIIKDDFISCLECLNNPKSWFEYPICQRVLVIKPNTSYYEALLLFGDVQYYFDGIQLNSIHNTYSFSYETLITNITGIYKEFYLSQNYFRQFCQQMDFVDTDQFICYECFIKSCQICQVTPTTFICVKCYGNYKLINGECIFQPSAKAKFELICLPPYYYSFDNYCKICKIKNCIYCFEYSTTNQNFCSLFKLPSLNLNLRQNFKIGCALCEENYIFDFTLELCLRQIPEIMNCQRSYINFQNQEQCVSSMNDDFSIAPEISNCQKYIVNCLICSLNVDLQIKCIVCQSNFIIENDQCYQNEELDVQKNLIYNLQNKIQSFILQFVPQLKQYVYNKFLNQKKVIECDPQCILCDQISTYCKFCPLNYYKKQIITELSNTCTYCHPFCEVCLHRSNKDIQRNYPLFIVNDQNQIYTKQCIKPYFDPSFSYDPYSQYVRYCFTKDCKDQFVFDVSYESCDFTRFNRYYESKINTQYCNQIGIEYLTINFVLKISNQQCFLILPFNIQTELKQKVINLKKVNLKFSSSQYLDIISFNFKPFYNFDQVEISNLGFVIDSNQHFIFYNSNTKIDLILTNFTITQSILQNIDSLFKTEQFGNITLNNFTIINTTLINSSIFNSQSFQMRGSINIINLQIKNCTFIESALFKLSQIESLLSYKYLIIDQSNLINSSIFTFYTTYPQLRILNGQNTIIKKNKFYNSYLINSTYLIQVNLQDFQLYSNLIDTSIIISVNYNIKMNMISIYQNVFTFSQFLSINQILLKNEILCNIIDFEAKQNQFQTSSLILIFSTLSTNFLIIKFSRFSINNNSKYSNDNGKSQLFCMNSKEIHISNFLINDNDDLIIFQLSENKNITIVNIIYQHSIQNFKIPLSQPCLTTNKKNKLLQVFGFTNIYIENVYILKIISVDEPIIQINPSYQNLSYDMNQIEIINLTFAENILIQSTLNNYISLLIIEQDNRVNIILENIKYEENFLHSYSSSAIRTTISLLYIQSSLSQLKVQNFLSKNNALTNSTNSFITVMSFNLILSNFTICNHNFLSQQLWVKYYELQFNENLNQDNLNEIVFQILQIKNTGGVGQFLVQNLSCFNCTFSKILAMQSLIFEITTTEEGYIDLQNITINQVQNNLLSTEKGTGCFSIYSSNSKLNLRLLNAFLSNILNRMASSIFTIIPSKQSNIILLQDIYIQNCLSLVNQIMNVQFSSLIANKNIITIKNMKIIQNYQVWIDYFAKIRDLYIQEITDTINNQNSLISFQNCIILIQEFFIEGLIINSVFQFANIPKLQLYNIKLDKIQVLYQFNLIQVIQLQQLQSIIVIDNLSIKNISLYQNNLIQQSTYQQQSYNIRGCKIVQQYIEKYQRDYIQTIVSSFQQNNDKESSLIYIQSISNLNGFYFRDVTFEKNDCQQCQKGLIFFELSDFKFIKFEKFNCNYNQIKMFGCLHFSSNTYIKQKVLIENSNFLFNNGTQGVGIFSQKVSLKIKQCKIINNNAKDLGGGLYMQLESSGFIVNRTIIIGNIARIGGGIYLDGNSNLNNNNFVSSLLLFNTAQEYGNNIIEIPTHLAFYINYMENPSQFVNINNQQINILHLKTYRMIEQGTQIFMKDLLIPSNQVIKTFKIFDIHQSKYIPFIQDIFLSYKNSRNEEMHKYINSSCKVQNKIITKDKQVIVDNKVSQILIYNVLTNSFDFGSLSFSLDPYKQEFNYLQIDISCQLIESNNTLKYRIYTKSLKCQLGEFYVNNGCQICQYNQGYYSVTYNATKCSIFDKSKYSDITSNMIKLLPGFWRPNNFSDYVEPCFKNPLFCIGGWQVGDQICSFGHIGALCEECDMYNIRGQGNFYKNQWDQNCRKCQFDWSSIFSFMLINLWTFISISMSLRSISKSNQLYSQLIIAQRFSKILFKLNQDQQSIQLKMLINYLWIYSVIFTFNIRFSFSLFFIEQTSDTSYFIAKDLDCYISSIQSVHILYLKIFTMLILMIILFNLVIAGAYLHTLITKQKHDISIFSNTALYLYVFNYAGLIKMFSSALSKREGDVSLQYGSQIHQKWMYYFIIPGIFIIGIFIPIFIYILLMLNKNKLDKIKLRKHICYLLNEYKQERYYWELIKLFKKSIIIFIMTNFETEIVLKASLLGLGLLIYQILAIFNKPFTIQKYNSLDLQTAQICSISIFLALTKSICEQKNYIFPSILIQIFIIGCFIKLCYPFVFGIARNYFKKYQFFYLNKLHFFLNLKVPNFYFAIILGKFLEKEKLRQNKLKYNIAKLKNHLIFLSKVQLRNSRQIISPQSSRILSTKSSRIGVEKVFFNNVEEYESNKR
ncbi:unnamed protein product [Paramecium primaurelia]|uniref:Transmembrane protein n=1 Tax=Paramecium primaurelia TaxID=5886 RepID=A0A8S1NLU6_PARPR|nr:unnamed protein product [Paramecium primaurelia]